MPIWSHRELGWMAIAGGSVLILAAWMLYWVALIDWYDVLGVGIPAGGLIAIGAIRLRKPFKLEAA